MPTATKGGHHGRPGGMKPPARVCPGTPEKSGLLRTTIVTLRARRPITYPARNRAGQSRRPITWKRAAVYGNPGGFRRYGAGGSEDCLHKGSTG